MGNSVNRSATVFVAMMLTASGALGQSSCRVLDMELADEYTGRCKNGFAEGFGEARGVAKYQGEFRAGKKHGKGIKEWISSINRGDRYEGEFANDRKEGIGSYTWSSSGPFAGERYIGGFQNDMRSGYGTYEWPSGDRYEGNWKHDSPIGSLTRMMKSRVLAETATAAAVSRRGAIVCKSVPIGIGSAEWIRGEVIEVNAGNISVQIKATDKQLVDGVLGSQNIIPMSPLLDWIPCY